MNPWRTGIVDADEASIRLRGYDVTALMQGATFTDTLFLLHRSRLPSDGERALLDAILVGVADHGAGAPSCATARLAASGNRQSLSAAVAAGILAIGDQHGGAGLACMELIGAGIEQAREGSRSLEDVARQIVAEARAQSRKLPGLGHRTHKVDPRTSVIFDLARKHSLAGSGIAFLEAVQAALENEGKTLPINIDGALAAVLYDLGFSPLFGMLVFIVGRVAGLSAEVAEEYEREKPMRIRIPLTYDGEPPRSLD